MEKQNRQVYIEYLQAFAIISVFLGHALRIYYSGGWYFHRADVNIVCDILDKIIYSFHMPLFVFLSGYLFFINKEKVSSAFDYIKKRTKRLLLPFFVAGFLYVLPMICIINPLEKSYLFYYQQFLNLKSCWHLWFLPMLYIVTVIFTLIIFKFKNYSKKWLLLILIALNLINISGPQSCIYSVPKYLIYFYMGCLAVEYKDLLLKIISKSFLGILFLFFILEILLYFYPRISLLILLVAVLAISILYYISIKISEKKAKTGLVAGFLSENLFMVYILHEPIMALILKNIDWGNSFPAFYSSNILFFGTLAICVVLICVYNKIFNKI